MDTNYLLGKINKFIAVQRYAEDGQGLAILHFRNRYY